MTDDTRTELRVGGVPEHFNAPWTIACASGDFDARPYAVSWTDFPGGTGAMCQALAEGTIDVAVLLADGIVSAILSGHTARVIGTYVDSPLYWGIHVHASTPYETPESIAGTPFAISRFGSGSHLMAYVEAHGRGWLGEHELEFVPVGGLEGAREAMAAGEAVGFLWERLMTRPLVDAGEWRQIGVRPSPWPAFLIAARPDVIAAHPEFLTDMMVVVQRRCHEMKAARARTIAHITERFGLEPEDVGAWLDETRWRCAPEVSRGALDEAVTMLHRVGLAARVAPVEALVATSLCELGAELPAALYDLRVGGVRDALSRAGKAAGPLTYEQLTTLGDFDRYYDYGIDSCRRAASILTIDDTDHVLEIGSRVGAAARFLAHHYGCRVTGVELQPALNAAARELTARCGLDTLVGFVSGDVSTLELPRGAFDHALALMVLFHLGDRAPAWRQGFDALRPGATMLTEELVARRPLTEAERATARRVLEAPNLAQASAYAEEARQAGFDPVEIEDLTDAWRAWTAERYDQFVAARDEHVRVHGEEIVEARRLFLLTLRDGLADGTLGGVRLVATRPE